MPDSVRCHPGIDRRWRPPETSASVARQRASESKSRRADTTADSVTCSAHITEKQTHPVGRVSDPPFDNDAFSIVEGNRARTEKAGQRPGLLRRPSIGLILPQRRRLCSSHRRSCTHPVGRVSDPPFDQNTVSIVGRHRPATDTAREPTDGVESTDRFLVSDIRDDLDERNRLRETCVATRQTETTPLSVRNAIY